MFLIIPTGVDYETKRLPVVTFTLIGINTLVYLIVLAFQFTAGAEDFRLWWYRTFWLTPADSVWYTYLTSLFVHAGFFHLLGNMVYLFLFGAVVEDKLGRLGFGVFYLLGGLAAGFSHIALTPDHFASAIPLGGASGAISACMGGFVLLCPRMYVEFKYLIFFFFRVYSGEFQLPSWVVLSCWFVKDLAFAVLFYTLRVHGAGVAFGAHTGGFVAGLLAVLVYQLVQRGSLQPAPAPPKTPTLGVAADCQLYLHDGQTEAGPFTPAQVAQMIALGSVNRDDHYWHDGLPEWRRIGDLL